MAHIAHTIPIIFPVTVTECVCSMTILFRLYWVCSTYNSPYRRRFSSHVFVLNTVPILILRLINLSSILFHWQEVIGSNNPFPGQCSTHNPRDSFQNTILMLVLHLIHAWSKSLARTLYCIRSVVNLGKQHWSSGSPLPIHIALLKCLSRNMFLYWYCTCMV
jgi:hypothetical protein